MRDLGEAACLQLFVKSHQRSLSQKRKNHRFTWTTDEIVNLQIKDTAAGQKGISLDEILEKHGKASSFLYTEGNGNIELSYASESIQGHHSSLRLTFEKDGTSYHLIRKSANILDEAYPTLSQGDSPYLWTKADTATLKVRDESTGNPGMSYEEIVQLFGLPRGSAVFISHLDAADSQHIGLDLQYLTSDQVYDNEWVHLILHRQEDGVFRLTTVTSHIDRRERQAALCPPLIAKVIRQDNLNGGESGTFSSIYKQAQAHFAISIYS